ncbi:hypothetical protein LJR066_005815 [Acidovorax sp. LjRoot66]|uniref:hypothetical protein n=1 Tax=Acidovorax sp. LjRoot66 TaxID=3342334 RepID=UPI000D7D0FEA
MRLDSLDLIDDTAPLVAEVNLPRFVAKFPRSDEELWVADVEVSRSESLIQRFEAIFFVEGSGLVSIFGIGSPDGYPHGLASDLALEQQAFITFLRGENARMERAVGQVLRIFSTHLYYSELTVTKAYLAARDSSLDAGVGYHDPESGAYVTHLVETDHSERECSTHTSK